MRRIVDHVYTYGGERVVFIAVVLGVARVAVRAGERAIAMVAAVHLRGPSGRQAGRVGDLLGVARILVEVLLVRIVEQAVVRLPHRLAASHVGGRATAQAATVQSAGRRSSSGLAGVRGDQAVSSVLVAHRIAGRMVHHRRGGVAATVDRTEELAVVDDLGCTHLAGPSGIRFFATKKLSVVRHQVKVEEGEFLDDCRRLRGDREEIARRFEEKMG